MHIKFAFAVNQSDIFEARHFGDAEKYMLYEWNNHELLLCGELINRFKNTDEEQEHGSEKKGEAIIEMLRENEVQVLVSKQFGKNIKMVNQFFIPVIINEDSPAQALLKLKNNIKWIEDDLSNSSRNFKLFTLINGTLKTIIK
ncbi:MAG: NifB/NifX family molybdenum-iron cluster-binding protein [Prolixibacteraceae bacterium]